MIRLIKSKQFQFVIVMVIVASIVITGTYAWSDFLGRTDRATPSIIPDNVILMDFSEQLGEIYAVNCSNETMLIRARLDEYMEIDGKPASPRDFVKLVYGNSVVLFAEWRSMGAPIGDYWVEDSDGWYYYAKQLTPGDATRILLQEVKQSNFNILVNGSHRIITSLQAVPKGGVNELFMFDKNSFTDGGILLMKYISGEFVEFSVGKDNR